MPQSSLREAKLKAETHSSGSQSNGSSGVDLKAVCRSLLKIVARLEENQYTEETLRQTAERELDDLADPASEITTSQG
jgi:hypothetical protein